MERHFDRVISADSHVLEPTDLWWKAIGPRFGERTPRIIDEHLGRRGRFFYTGAQVLKIDQTEAEMEKMGDLVDAGRDPSKRVQFQKEAGVEAEVLNPTLMMLTMQGTDREVVRAAAQAYNDWLAEFSSHSPETLLGIGAVPMDDVAWGLKELDRVVKKGLRGAMINVVPPEGCPPYRDRVYDPFWAAAQEMEMPITLHSITGRVPDPLHFHTREEIGRAASTWLDLFTELAGVLADDFIFGQILDRFPRLKLICAEWEISWIPAYMFRLDQIQGALAHRIPLPKLEMTASDYVRKRMWHGMIDDPLGRDAVQHIGADGVMWGSDFPHIRSIGLEAHETLSEILDGLTAEEQEKIVGGNVAAVHGL
ncbi:MAG: amidohydrolase [Chloroflexi bacterium]|nr:amidohydrolase [Chloroflexota bacterium]